MTSRRHGVAINVPVADFAVEEAKPSWCLVVMTTYFIPRPGDARPLVRVEPDRVELPRQLFVIAGKDVAAVLDPLAGAVDLAALPLAGRVPSRAPSG